MSLSLAIFGAANAALVKETDKGIGLMGVTPFIASQYGYTMAQVEAHRDTMPLVLNKTTQKMVKPSFAKAVKAMILRDKKADEKQITALYKTYDAGRNQMYAGMRQQNAILASDPNVRVTLRATKNVKTGKVSRVHATYAPLGEGVSKAAQISQLKAEVARLQKAATKGTLLADAQVETL